MELEESNSLTSNYTTKLQSSKQHHTSTKTDTDQWNRIESPEVNPCTYGQLNYDEGENIQFSSLSVIISNIQRGVLIVAQQKQI